uniref:Uncharacterized protein n=1 Tax=Timema douglasi TaxID=61478 RepID=A0A7R8W2X5_TIMDO|nr:unnamed protein product [Timema douglasi]
MRVIGCSVEMTSSGEQEWKEVADKMVHPSLPMHGIVALCHSLSRTVQGESFVRRISTGRGRSLNLSCSVNKVRKLLRIYPEHHPNLPSSAGDLGAFLGPV